MKKPSQRSILFAELFVIFTALIGVVVYYSTRPSEVDLLKKSLPDAVRFYEENAELFQSLRDIQKKYETAGEDGYWDVGRNLEGNLRTLGLPQSKWDKVSLFNEKERRTIEAAFAIAYNDIAIQYFNSKGEVWLKSLGKYYMEMIYFPDEESYQDWTQNFWVVNDEKWLRAHWPIKHSEPVADGWYVFIIDGRPV